MPDTFPAAIRPEFAQIQDTIPDPNLYTFNKTPANLARPSDRHARMQGNVFDKRHRTNQPKTHSAGSVSSRRLNLDPSPRPASNAHAGMA